ncbi:DMT family transporter [Thalassobacillus hwangdonensis]|uniref:DMT family transporter n=1 Tax=Thalassobacillus hwangdonensis TaxID=546108 RepID=UPI0036DB7F44
MGKLYTGLIMLSLIWGTSFVFIKVLVSEMGFWEVVFWRCLFGALTLWIILLVKKRPVKWNELPWFKIMAVGLLNNTLPWGLIALSETVISSSLASILNATTPIFTSIIGFLFFHRVLKGRQWAGIGVGFFGMFLLSGIQGQDFVNGDFIGIGTMIGAAICYGYSSQYVKKHLTHIPPIVMAAVSLSFAACFAVMLAMFNGPLHLTKLADVETLASIIGLGSFGSGIAILIFYFLIQRGSAEFASTVTYLVPITAMLWGVLFLDEIITKHMFIGLVLVLIGVYMSTYKKKQEEKGHA